VPVLLEAVRGHASSTASEAADALFDVLFDYASRVVPFYDAYGCGLVRLVQLMDHPRILGEIVCATWWAKRDRDYAEAVVAIDHWRISNNDAYEPPREYRRLRWLSQAAMA
jgi:hypothetical protein